MRPRPGVGAGVIKGLLLLAAVAAAPAVRGEDAATVERVEVQGNRVIQSETLLFYISTKAGDRYDELRLKDDFRRLWATSFLDNLVLQVVDGPKGKVVVFQVQERKRIQIVDYRGSKELTTTNIEEKLKEKDAAIKIDTFYDPGRARKVEEIIRQMLADKGRPFGSAKHDAKAVGNAGLQVSFTIDDGPKARLKTIEFEGNQVFDDGKLRKSMKKLKPSGFWNLSWLGGKTTYTEEKWGEDQEKVRDYYLDRGYVTATVDKPAISYTDGKSGFFKKKPVKWMKLSIPVSEGDQYLVGDVKFDGLTVFKEEGIRPLFKLHPGEVYNESRIKKAYEKLQEIYGTQGYFQWTGYTERKPDAEKKVVDLVLHMEEDKRYYVGRIRFTGNDTTRDKVIRREVYLTEGDVFNTELLKLTIKRINQMGYFKPMEGAPNLGKSPLGEDKLDITFKMQEQNRNQFTFGGGVSGLEGTFLNASFSTTNFLGKGETLNVSAQAGKRTKNYQVAVTEPYLLDKPITAGIDLFKRRIQYESFGAFRGYTQDGLGGVLTLGFVVGRFSRIYTNYSYELIDIQGLTTSSPVVQPNGQPVFDPALFDPNGRRRESKITPSFVYNTVDNPFSPRSGRRYTITSQFSGGPLGGTVDYYRPEAEGILYFPYKKRTALGLRVDGSYILPFGDTRVLPYYQRFFLGGENQIRGYNVRSVGPIETIVNPTTGLPQTTAVGGNKFVLFNAEYYIDIFGPLRFLLFFDAGQAYREGQKIDLKELRTSTGAELRFLMPVLNVPFRLIYAWNPHRDSFQPAHAFKFSVGTTF
jgi:outer membrane protein insertion porin family